MFVWCLVVLALVLLFAGCGLFVELRFWNALMFA